MRTLQKTLLVIILAIGSVDFLSQLADYQHISFWLYIFAFIIGSMVTGFLMHYYSHISIIALALCLIGVIQGGYLLNPSPKIYLYFRAIHGLLLSTILTTVVSWLCNLVEKENFLSLCKFFVPVPLFALFVLPLHQAITPMAAFHWVLFVLMFSYFFIGVLCLLLMDYLSELNKRVSTITYNKVTEILSTPTLYYYYIAVLVCGYTFATLSLLILKTEIYSIESSQLNLLGVLLISLTLTFLTKLGGIGQHLGDMKSILMGLLLMAFGLGLLPLIKESTLLFVPMILWGLSLGILLPSILGGLSLHVTPSKQGFIIGILHFLLLIGYSVGVAITLQLNSHLYYPHFINSLLIISTSIFFIRKIHQQAESYKM
ncbi:MFS transporter [Alkaliphilus transvaalensis]|uniref:MFS transporter n=1 Tax=Alkaliphilus transvaalensis TaxID=114628 RepID=UPI00047B23EB|nr:MFS transporter [Alkaliphilus transvaalensis]